MDNGKQQNSIDQPRVPSWSGYRLDRGRRSGRCGRRALARQR
jgi:hypothetical protein